MKLTERSSAPRYPILAPLAVAFCVLLLTACGAASDDDIYTLYRSSAVLERARLHVASFDAAEGEKYNSENCQQAQELFQGQPRVTVRFWCEKGRFKK